MNFGPKFHFSKFETHYICTHKHSTVIARHTWWTLNMGKIKDEECYHQTLRQPEGSVARNLRLRLHHERCVRPCHRPYGNRVFLAKGDLGSKNCKREYIMSFHQMLSHFSQNENALTCAICIDLVTDIDEFLTSDTTEDQIVQFVEQVAMSDHSCKWLSRK